MPMRVSLEVGSKRVFASALDWPGWCRRGRDEDSALQALIDYGPRYAKAIRIARAGFVPAKASRDLDVVERLKGNATTDFGAPGVAAAAEDDPLDEKQAARLAALLRACWRTFDRAARAAEGLELRKGPRGGGRELDAIVSHVLEADRAYLVGLGGRRVGHDMAEVREAFVEAFLARARGEPPPRPRRTGAKLWSPPYAVRRSAWHALDHAWEIEDRKKPRPRR